MLDCSKRALGLTLLVVLSACASTETLKPSNNVPPQVRAQTIWKRYLRDSYPDSGSGLYGPLGALPAEPRDFRLTLRMLAESKPGAERLELSEKVHAFLVGTGNTTRVDFDPGLSERLQVRYTPVAMERIKFATTGFRLPTGSYYFWAVRGDEILSCDKATYDVQDENVTVGLSVFAGKPPTKCGVCGQNHRGAGDDTEPGTDK